MLRFLMPHHHESTVEHIEKLSNLMDSQFNIPGTSIKLGLDTIIGFVPGIGDTIGLAISGYIVSQAARIGVQKRTLGRMGFNIGIDWLIGLIPLIGDLFDWDWKANNKNAELMREHHERAKAMVGVEYDIDHAPVTQRKSPPETKSV